MATIVQMALPLQIEPKQQYASPEEQAKRENIEAFLLHSRTETNKIFAIVQDLFPDSGYTNAKEVSNDHWTSAENLYEQDPLPNFCPPHPEFWRQGASYWLSKTDRPLTAARKGKAYKPWPLERRQQTAARSLMERAKKRSSFPEWWQNWVQQELLKDPWRFGVCQLPSEGDACIIPNPEMILAREMAIAREIQFREQEQGLVQPLQMPLTLKQPEYIEVLVSDRP